MLLKILLAISCIASAQLENNIKNCIEKVNLNSIHLISDYNKKGAFLAIKKNNIKILFSGGFGGMPNFKNKSDIQFQKKYKVEFFSQGCVRYGENEDEEGYNKIIFEYLDKKYGTKWRKEIRNDAIGFIRPN